MRLVIVLATAAACGGELSIEDYAQLQHDASCKFLERCGVVSSIEMCDATRTIPFYDANVQAAIDNGTVEWHGDVAAACLDRYDQLSCDRTSESYRFSGCGRFLTGTRRDGEACVLDVECVAGECWTGTCTDACCVGYCVGDTAPVVARIGESCGISTCEAGAYCEDRVCVPLRKEGEPCTNYPAGECDYGLVCDFRRCTRLASSGERCSKNWDCVLVGERCGPLATCVPAGQFGDECQSSENCTRQMVCGVDSRCVPGPRLGGRCDSYEQNCYDAGLYCDLDSERCAAWDRHAAPTCVTPE